MSKSKVKKTSTVAAATPKASKASKVAVPSAKAKTRVKKVEKKHKKSKKVKPEPEPEPEPESESDSDSKEPGTEDSVREGSASENPVIDNSKSRDSSSESSESSAEEEENMQKDANSKHAKLVARKAESDSESEDSSDESSFSFDNEEREEDAKPKSRAPNGKASKVESDISSEDESGEEESSEDSDEDSGDSEDENAEEKTADMMPPKINNKRKAEAQPEHSEPTKKVKTEGESCTLFAGNLSWGVDEDRLAEAFQGCKGFTAARVVTSGGRSKGFGYIDFSSNEDAQAALESMADTELDGRTINLDMSNSRRQDSSSSIKHAAQRASKYGDSLSPESDTLFIGNLPFSADEDLVSAHFNAVAPVQSLRLPTDRDSGQRKGFGYVTFSSVEDAKSALNQLNGSRIGTNGNFRSIRLDFSQPRPGRDGFAGGNPSRGGRGGRGGGRGEGRGGRGGGIPRFQGKKITF